MSKSSRGNPSMGDILRTTFVLGGGLLLVFVIATVLFTRTPDHPTNEIDYKLAASGVEAMAKFDPLVPAQLPPSARVTVAKFDGNSWFLVASTSDSEFISVEQARLPIKSAVERAEVSYGDLETVTIDGVDWQRSHDAEGRIAIVRQDGDLTTIVIGTGDWSETSAYASSLVPFSEVDSASES